MTIRKLRHLGIAISIAALACHAPTDPTSNQTRQGGDLTHPTGTVVATTALGGQPYGLAINSSGDLLVAQVFADSVTRFSLPGTSPIGATFFGLQGPVTDSGTSFIGTGTVHLALNPAGTRAYVIEQFGNAVRVFDLASNSITASIPLTNSGYNIIVAPDGQRVYASTEDGRLYVIATLTNMIVDSMAVGPAANGFAFSPDGNILYTSSRDAGTVTAFSTSDDALLTTYHVGGRPQRLAVAPDGQQLYAANEDAGLSVVNLSNGSVLPSVNPMGSGYGLGLTPDGAQLYLTDPSTGRLAIIDRASLGTVNILTLGGVPRNVAFSADGSTGVVTDGDGRVIFIQ
jgi:DNA-binding beta-propeller fold protein YncE